MHHHAAKARFPDWILFAKFAMLVCILRELQKRFRGEALRIAVVDIKSAYRSMDMNRAQRILLLMRLWCFKSKADADLPSSKRKLMDTLQYVLDLAAAFGGRWSGYGMYELVCGAVWIFERVLAPAVGLEVGVAVATDDFVVVGTKTQCGQGMELLLMLLRGIGWTVEGKIHPDVELPLDVPQARTVWTGVGADVTNPNAMHIFAPPAYWKKNSPEMRAWADGTLAATITAAESMQGKAFWLSAMVPNMTSHIQPIIYFVVAKRASDKEPRNTRLRERAEKAESASRDAMKLMLKVVPLLMPGGYPITVEVEAAKEWEIGIFSDSTKGSDDGSTPPAFGVMVCGYYVGMPWPAKAIARATNPDSGLVNNTILEMMARGIAVWLAGHVWPTGLARRTVRVFNGCDNQACVHEAQRGRSGNPVSNDVLRGLDTLAAVNGWRVEEEHQPGGSWLPTNLMIFCDALSRAWGDGGLKYQRQFMEEVGARPCRRIFLPPDSPLFDWSDPCQILELTMDIPLAPPEFIRAWQPLQGEGGTAQGYLGDARWTRWNSTPGRGTGQDGAEPQGSAWVDGFPSSWTRSHTADGTRSRPCGHSGSACCGTGAVSQPPPSTSDMYSNSTRTSSVTGLPWDTEVSTDGGGSCSKSDPERPTVLELRPAGSWLLPAKEEQPGAEEKDGGKGEARRSTSVSLGPWRWLGSLPFDGRSTRPIHGPEPEHFSFDGVGCGFSEMEASGANPATGSAPMPRCGYTESAAGEGRRNGCLCTLREMRTYVDSAGYASSPHGLACPGTSQYSSERMGDTSQGET